MLNWKYIQKSASSAKTGNEKKKRQSLWKKSVFSLPILRDVFIFFGFFPLFFLMYATWENPEGLHLFASWLVSPPPAPACHSRLGSCGMLCICVCARASFGCGGRIAAGLGKVWQSLRCKHAHTHTHTHIHHPFTQTDFSKPYSFFWISEHYYREDWGKLCHFLLFLLWTEMRRKCL